MKLQTIEVEAFRAFNRSATIDLSGDVVLLHGRNGFGKTTIFDAVSWCLFGSSKRFGGSRDFSRADANFVTNAFRTPGDERVRLTIGDGAKEIIAERKGSEFFLYDADNVENGAAGERRVLELIGFQSVEDESIRLFQRRARDSFSRSFLLQQEQLSAFITSEIPRQRFDAFAELFSLTPIREFYSHLVSESGKAGQQADSVHRQEDLEAAQLRQLERQLNRENARVTQVLQQSSTAQASRAAAIGRLRSLLSDAKDLVGDITWNEEDLVGVLDSALIDLTTRIESTDRTVSQLQHVSDRMPLVSGWSSQLEVLTSEAMDLETAATAKRVEIQQIEERLTTERAALTELEGALSSAQSASRRLQSLLSDAIEAITDDTCPICSKPIPRTELIERLRERLQASDPDTTVLVSRRQGITDNIQTIEEEHLVAGRELRRLETALQERKGQIAELERSISEVQQALSDHPELPAHASAQELDERIATNLERKRTGEKLASDLKSLKPALELLQGREQIGVLEQEVNQRRAVVDAFEERRKAYLRARGVLDALVAASRRAERHVVEDFITRFKGPIQTAYRWLAPHPLFGDLDFEFQDFDEAGELYFKVSNDTAQLNPATTFSSSQSNALALAVFLALNASQRWSPLQIALIDDPVQNLDDVNVLALVDFLRNVAKDRQLILSTSSPSLHRLLMDKLRPTDEGHTMITHVFSALMPGGPSIEPRVIGFVKAPRALDKLLELSA